MGSAEQQNRPLRSLEEIRAEVPRAVRALARRPELARAAAVDPVRAFEALGHRIEPSLLPTVRRRVRFPAAAWERLEELAAAVRAAAGRDVDVDDPADLRRLLFEELELPGGCPTDPLPDGAADDPLAQLRDAHPVLGPLLEYRRLEAGAPRLGDEAAFRRALAGDGLAGVDSVRFRLRRSG